MRGWMWAAIGVVMCWMICSMLTWMAANASAKQQFWSAPKNMMLCAATGWASRSARSPQAVQAGGAAICARTPKERGNAESRWRAWVVGEEAGAHSLHQWSGLLKGQLFKKAKLGPGTDAGYDLPTC